MPEKYTPTTLFTINNLVDFHPGDRTLTNKITEKCVTLQTPASFILSYLLTHDGLVISQTRLVEVGWGEKNNITSINTLYQTVLTLRNALTEVGLPRDMIKTVARRGMVLSADILRLVNDAPSDAGSDAGENSAAAISPVTSRRPRRHFLAGALFVSILLVGVGASVGFFYTTSESMFSAYTLLDATSISSCTILLKGKEALNTRYIHFLRRHQEICRDHHYVYISGMESTKNIAAVACQMDIRKNPSTKCITWYSINNEN